MFRLIGYIGGIILFFALGVRSGSQDQFGRTMFVFAILNIIAIVLTIIYRVLCSWLVGFKQIYHRYLQKQIAQLLSCLGQYTIMPQYRITTKTTYSDGSVKITQSETCNTCIVGLIQMAIFMFISVLVPLYLLFLFYCVGAGLAIQCRSSNTVIPVQPINNRLSGELDQTPNIDLNKLNYQMYGQVPNKNYQITNQNQIPYQVTNKNYQIPNQNQIPSQIVIKNQDSIYGFSDRQ